MKLKIPSFSQWRRIFKVLTKKEQIVLVCFFALTLGSLIFLLSDLYIKSTVAVPASGGSYTEGAVGQPRFLNPVYGETNDIDRDLVELTFSGLMSYNDDGGLAKDLVENYKISEDGKTYDFTLRDNLLWHDGKPLTPEDVLFTIKTIQNSDYRSPLRANWLDVNVEIVSDKSFRFELKSPYNGFLENCAVKIIPKHIWENILPENFALSFYNLQPVGSGPYKFKAIRQTETGFVKSLTLKANNKYYRGAPHVSEIIFSFFEKKDDLLKAISKKQVDGFSSLAIDEQKSAPRGFSFYSFSTPRYFALFLNDAKNDIFLDAKVRQALNYAANKNELIAGVIPAIFKKYGINGFQIADSPILPDFFGYNKPAKTYEYNIDKAKELLDSAGFKENEQGQREKSINKKPAFQFASKLSTGSSSAEVTELQKCLAKDPNIYQGDATGYFGKATKEALIKFQNKYLPSLKDSDLGAAGKSTRAKLNELCTPPAQNTLPLKFTVTTIEQPLLKNAANMLKDQWQKIGAIIEIKTLSILDLKSAIKNRDYDALLYGEALGISIDPYPFWHSSQRVDPGLNLCNYESKDADKLLKEARETLDETEKQKSYESFQDIFIKDAPAVLLYNSSYVYLISNKIKGVETKKIVNPAKRFANIEDWYVKTKRAWK